MPRAAEASLQEEDRVYGGEELQRQRTSGITKVWERHHVIDNALNQWHKTASVLVSLQRADNLNICCEYCTIVAANTNFYCQRKLMFCINSRPICFVLVRMIFFGRFVPTMLTENS